MKKIGFIGIGVMGKHMAPNLIKSGFELYIYSRTKSKAQEVIEAGAIWCDSIKECVSNCEAVITMIGYPKDVEEVYFGQEGILNSAKPGTYLIDMTTTSPKLSKRIYQAACSNNLYALDAPVSGGDVGAKKATLIIMVGGDKQAFENCLPVFKAIGTNIVYQGEAGLGQHAKMANQIALSGIISSLCESITYAQAVGLDVETMLKAISGGAAGSWQMANTAPRIIKGDLNPGFYIKHFIKDMEIAKEESQTVDLDLCILEEVLKLYKHLEQKNMGDLGTQALIKYYEK
jgi:3-hydroxyisobutyrate dehydrogenase-like beta-hydroxyacid dehydrogenase